MKMKKQPIVEFNGMPVNAVCPAYQQRVTLKKQVNFPSRRKFQFGEKWEAGEKILAVFQKNKFGEKWQVYNTGSRYFLITVSESEIAKYFDFLDEPNPISNGKEFKGKS